MANSWGIKFNLRRAVAMLVIICTGAALAACSETGGRPRGGASGDGGGGVDTPRYTVAMVSHGAPGDTFWDLVRAGAEDAAKKNNLELRYSSSPQAPDQANLVQNAIDSNVDGLALTMLFTALQAPDVAFSQLVVGTAALPLLFLVVLANLRLRQRRPNGDGS